MNFPFRPLTIGLLATLGWIIPPTVPLIAQSQPNWQLKPDDLTPLPQNQTLAPARQEQLAAQVKLIQPDRFDLQRYPIIDATEKQWKQTLWATAVLELKADYIANSFVAILDLTRDRNLTPSQRAVLQRAMQVATQLYLSDPVFYQGIGDQFEQMLTFSPYSDWVAMALMAKLQAGMPPEQAQAAINLIKERFVNYSTLPLQVALWDAQEQINPQLQPPLKDLLNWQIAPKQAQLYVFCRPDRSIVCTAVLKDRQGRWLRQNSRRNAPLWSVPLLARSIHPLRWHLSRGYTPQGIFRIEGVMPRSPSKEFRAYGQFPLVKLFIPFEPGVKTFIPPNIKQLPDNLESYQSLLPPTWRNYFPIQGTFWAGKLGRSLFRIHGSGENLDFFGSNQRFPQSYGWNPSIGCLSAVELYDPQTGQLKRADIVPILQNLSRGGQGQIEGFAIVVEVPGDAKQPLSVKEIEAAIESGGL